MNINEKLLKIERENAFSKSNRLLKEFKDSHPHANIISLGIGDVSFPVAKPILNAMKKACDDLSDMKTFQGYGAYWGIESLRKAISENDYEGLSIGPEEIYVGDGTKTDSTALLEIFSMESRILTGNPSYPIYKNGAYALGRDIFEADCDDEFKMVIPSEHFDVIYICSPCNPVGNAYTRDELLKWIAYAKREDAVIIFDNVYKDFANDPDIPRSIYELEGSRSCAVELRSYSKNISFSGTRCSYMVIPKEFGEEFHSLWRERTINRFNGASYVAQKGAEASYLPEVRKLTKERIDIYKGNADILKDALKVSGFTFFGGTDSPYIWAQTPDRLECWDAFRFFLEEMNIVVVPGLIFGSKGKYSIRLSALGSRESTLEAAKRIKSYYEKNS